MPGLLARLFFIPSQIKKQIQNVSVHQSGFVHYLSLLLLAFFSLVMIVLVTVVQKGTVGDFRSRAWSGITYNAQQLQLLTGLKKKEPNPFTYEKDHPGSTKTLFHKLTRTYFDAEVQNINLPSLNISGVAFLKYDTDLKKSFVYTRIENLPLPVNQVVRLWMKSKTNEYTKVGIASYYLEFDRNVAYSVYVTDGDIRTNDSLLVSFDSYDAIVEPQAVVLQLKF